MNVYLDHGTEVQPCTCTAPINGHFRGLNHQQTVERLVETLRDADALLKMSHAMFGTIRDNLEGKCDRKQMMQMVELTYSTQCIINGFEDKITRAWLGD
jgi:hypothetical protein